MLRRTFLTSASAALAPAADPYSTPAWEAPLFNLRDKLKSPVRIASIDVLRAGGKILVRSTSSEGATGIVLAKDPIEDYLPILLRRVIPFYLNKDARDLESLIDGVYQQHYKLAGQGFWLPVAAVEMSLWDLLGRTSNKTVADLMGGARMKAVPVYLSGSGREVTAEEEVDVYVRGVQETGAKAVKFKIGGRMSRNADTYPKRTETMLALARKRFGPDVKLYADANGSYDVRRAIEVGRFLESLDFKFFEEPCPWEQIEWTKAVADALKIPIAFGEQNSSLAEFQRIINLRAFKIVQPDLNYNGGIVKAARVARMAAKAGMTIVNHNTETGAAGAKLLHFAAATPNFGPDIEWARRTPPKPVSWQSPNLDVVSGAVPLPTGPGFGIKYDPDYLKKAQRVL
ncbi:MAG TPA: mandelate racemase/muconate lactonizing enzyme family protein [Bryobacteraceae bacterium]|nr:mandelate racemase/muconate lactonizing enzyme family protein [Bryobacteraceae bacterium]